jgi:adenylosuccinate lyase
MSKLHFTDEDKQKVVEFLNLVATNATFEMKTDDIIKYFRALSHMQQVILPKINANIFEIKQVHETPPEEKPAKAKKGS